MDSAGLEAVFLENRTVLLRFMSAHGAGDDAEDLLQELWLKIREARPGPVAQPLAYLYRAANNLMLDRYRSGRQSVTRERNWSEANAGAVPGQSDAPSGERVLIARETLGRVERALAALGPRVDRIFRRHRLEGAPQKELASEFGVSLSTVESDLRKATAMLIGLRAEIDQGSPRTSPSKGQDHD